MGGIGWATLDLAPDFSFRLSKDVQALTDVNEILTDSVLPFSVPFSTVNDYAMLPFSSPSIVDATLGGVEARAECDGVQLPFDMIFFRQKNSSGKTWEMEFRRSPDHWLELASNKMLNTIECGEMVFSVANAEASWANPVWADGEPVYCLAPADYGGWVDLVEPIQFTDPPMKQIWLEDTRPFISLPYLLKQGFCEIGWTLGGLILETEWFNSLWVYILSREYYTQSKGGDCKLIGSAITVLEPPDSFGFNGIGVPLFLQTIEYDPGSHAVPSTTFPGYYWAGYENPLAYKASFRFCFSGNIDNTTGLQRDLFLAVFDFSVADDAVTYLQIGTGVFMGNLAATTSGFFNACIEVDLEPGQAAMLGILINPPPPSGTVDILPGFKFWVEPAFPALIRGDVVELNRLISGEENYTLLNLLKSAVQLFNGRIETDWNSRTLTLHPYRVSDVYGTAVPGFIDDAAAVDLRGKVICDSARLSPVKANLTRYTRLQFSESTDAYIDSLNLPEPPHSRKVLNGLELQNQVTELANEFFEPTLEGQSDKLRRVLIISGSGIFITATLLETPYLPRMWDNTDGNRSFAIAPRILYHYGDVAQVTDALNEDIRTGIYWEGSFGSAFGYLSQARTFGFAPGTPTHLDGSVVFGTLPDDLYVSYWLGYLLAQRRGVLMDILAWINMNDWSDWNFRQPMSFDYEGVPVKVNLQSIRDFAPATDLPTPLTLLAAPMMTDCCDLPCSCRFSECDNYQDLGQFLSQSTLDTLSITSFKVNGIEQLVAPVDLGIINIEQYNGRAFVTNLVDALNGIGVDYFFFKVSTREYSLKDDLRFFKIKRPACWSYEIIISDAGGEVYRYTDTETVQMWFDVTWEPFGYGGDPVSEPLGCVVTVEY